MHRDGDADPTCFSFTYFPLMIYSSFTLLPLAHHTSQPLTLPIPPNAAQWDLPFTPSWRGSTTPVAQENLLSPMSDYSHCQQPPSCPSSASGLASSLLARNRKERQPLMASHRSENRSGAVFTCPTSTHCMAQPGPEQPHCYMPQAFCLH